MRPFFVPLSVTCVVLGCVSAFGEDACSKSYTKWNENYSRKVLTDSPWSKPFILARVHSQAEGYQREDIVHDPNAGARSLTEKDRNWGIDRGHGVGGEKEIYDAYTLRLFSALPVRQAFVRMFQIVNHYEKMPPRQKQELDQKFAQALAMDMSEQIVVTVSFTATDQEVSREVDRQLHQATADSLKARAYLITEHGGRIPLKDYYPPSGDGAGAKLVFPRTVDGQPVVNGTDNELAFEFTVPGPEHRIFVTWKVKDLVCQGQPLL
jgi:hypothetical protein